MGQQLFLAERWGMVNIPMPAVSQELQTGFNEYKLILRKGERALEAPVFVDDAGTLLARFMPDEEGEWSYEASCGGSIVDGGSGLLRCTAPTPGNRGLVRVVGASDFAYDDGTVFVPFGTTCLKGLEDERLEQTLSTMKNSPFNKLRLLVSSGNELGTLEKGVAALAVLGVEAELVIECGDGGELARQLLGRVLARFAAFRNVWWSLRFDKVHAVPPLVMEGIYQLVQRTDPYNHLLTIFGSDSRTDYGHRAVTHVSLLNFDLHRIPEFARLHRKPIIVDECGSEGNSPELVASLSGEEMAHRIWMAVCRKGYAGHGETYVRPQTERSDDYSDFEWAARSFSGGRTGEGEETWQRHGGTLNGTALPRIAFLRGLLRDAPHGLRYMPEYYDASTIGRDGEWYLQYHGIHRFPYKEISLPTGSYEIDVIDVWKMTIESRIQAVGGDVRVPLPSLPYYAIRIRSLESKSALTDGHLRDEDVQRLIRSAEENDNFIAKGGSTYE